MLAVLRAPPHLPRHSSQPRLAGYPAPTHYKSETWLLLLEAQHGASPPNLARLQTVHTIFSFRGGARKAAQNDFLILAPFLGLFLSFSLSTKAVGDEVLKFAYPPLHMPGTGFKGFSR